jgi:hypothetical protein
MRTLDELKYDINKQTVGLHKEVSADREENVNPNEISTKMNNFLVSWSDTLVAEQSAHLDATRSKAEASHPEIGKGATVEQERDRARLVIADNEKAAIPVNDQISQLRDGLFQSIVEIDSGREPSLAIEIVAQMDAERKNAFINKMKAFDKSHEDENERSA